MMSETIQQKEKTYPGLRKQEDNRKVLPKAKLTLEQTKRHLDDLLNNIIYIS